MGNIDDLASSILPQLLLNDETILLYIENYKIKVINIQDNRIEKVKITKIKKNMIP